MSKHGWFMMIKGCTCHFDHHKSSLPNLCVLLRNTKLVWFLDKTLIPCVINFNQLNPLNCSSNCAPTLQWLVPERESFFFFTCHLIFTPHPQQSPNLWLDIRDKIDNRICANVHRATIISSGKFKPIGCQKYLIDVDIFGLYSRSAARAESYCNFYCNLLLSVVWA